MNIALVRVDDRFIHGQILEAWIPHLKVDAVVVANDNLARDQFQRTIMSLAVPDRIALRIFSLKDSCAIKDDPGLDGKVTLVIVSSLEDAKRLFSNGVEFARLNLGNMKSENESRQLSYSVWINDNDMDILKDLMNAGVSVNLQSVPRERQIDMRSIVDMVDK